MSSSPPPSAPPGKTPLPPPRAVAAPGPSMVGKTVWVPHDAEVWTLAEVVREGYDSLRVSIARGAKKEERDVLKTQCCETNPVVVEDMSSLHHMHEPGILHNLRERFLRKQIYTCMGAAMIAVNPFQAVPQPKMQDFSVPGQQTEPHPFAIAENAYRNLNVLKKNQSIVISGESGSGKTETAKIVVKYLADRNLSHSNDEGKKAVTAGDQLYEQLQGLSPILESFGNAKTTRNNNSSRFGKFMKLNFELVAAADKKAHRMELRGSCIETYLLEKSRVVHQSDLEQNFHIFYALLRHPPAGLRRFLCRDAESKTAETLHFRIARKPLDGGNAFFLDDEHHLREVEEAFLVLGLDAAQIEQVWRVLVALLHLGNVCFDEIDSPQGPISCVSQRVFPVDDKHSGENAQWSGEKHLQIAAELLCVDVQTLRLLLTQRQMQTRGETFHVPVSVREANFARDAVNKSVYESLFAHLVRVMNGVIDTSKKGGREDDDEDDDDNNEDGKQFIGVLDIFGFESFERNGFEQLLINFANEALQNTFNNQIFERERQLFAEEKIEMKVGECPSNIDCVNLIFLRGESVFGKLDSISRQPNPSDTRFCEELHKAFSKKNKHFGAVHRKDMAHLFVINHYAAPVAYSVGATSAPSSSATSGSASGKGNNSSSSSSSGGGEENAWITKNNDSVPDGLEELFLSSELRQFKLLSAAARAGLPIELLVAKGSRNSTGAASKRRKSVMMRPTIAEMFSKSMRELTGVLDATQCHFVRCVKPNAAMRPGDFDLRYVVDQVRALGILQACEVLSVGLPTRIPYAELKSALQSTIQRVQRRLAQSRTEISDVLLISALLKAYAIPIDSYRLGVSIAFFRPGQLAALETIFNQDLQPDREAQIAQAIESSVHQYERVMGEIANGREQLNIAAEFASELEARQERLRENASSLPEMRGLDIPPAIARQIATAEQQLHKLRTQNHETVREKLCVERLLAQHAIDLADEKVAKVLDTQAVAQFFSCFEAVEAQIERIDGGHKSIQRAIAELEEAQSTTAQTNELNAIVQRNDAIYEELMDGLARGEGLLQEITIFAERGNVDAAYSAFEKMNEEIAAVNARTLELSTLIQKASEIIKSIEDSLANVCFDGVEQLLSETIAAFADFQSATSQCHDVLYSFLSQLENYTPYVEPVVAPAPPPPPPPPPVSKPSKRVSISASVSDEHVASDVSVSVEEETTSSLSTASIAASAERRPSLAARRRLSSFRRAERRTSAPSLSLSVESAAGLDSLETLSISEESAAGTAPAKKEKTTAETSAKTELPPNWKELFDPKSNRPYYVNRVTKERQWKRPTVDGADSSGKSGRKTSLETVPEHASVSVPVAVSLSPVETPSVSQSKAPPPPPRPKSMSSDALPPNWRAVVDKKSGRTYFVNDITKQRQWRRPEADSSPSERPLSVKESVIENIDRRASKRISTRLAPLHNTLSPEKAREDDFNNMSNALDLVYETVTRARRVSAMIMSEEMLSDTELDDGAKETVSYMVRIGTRDHAGYLMKQSKLLGRWRKRYFVLQNQTLTYFDNEKDYMYRSMGNKNTKAEKTFQLHGSSQTSYTTTENCLSVSNPAEDEDEDSAWYLLAESEASCDEWMRFVNSHIHVQFLRDHNLQGRDFWEEGTVSVSIWKVPQSPATGAQRRPVGIRTLPMVNGPRSGEGLYPGDVVEIVQVIHEDKNDKQQTYLRLANDRGWVFEMHPHANYAIMVPAGGEIKEALLKFSYSANFLENLRIFSTPHCHPDSVISMIEGGMIETSIAPGAVVEGCAQWTILSNQLYPGGSSEYGEEEETFVLSFVKLRDGRGWVPVYHPVTGGQLLVPIEAKPKKP